MKAAFMTLLAGVLALSIGLVAFAEDKKDTKKVVTLKGNLGCPKCVFKLDKKITGGKCGNAIEVTEKKDGKDVKVVYVLVDKGKAEKYHGPICTAEKAGSVKGVVSKKGKQMYITPVKGGVKFD